MDSEKLLIVDDDALIGWALQRELASFNFQSRVVTNAADTLAEVRSDSYDLIFLDIHLPDGNGIELLEEIGRISPNSKIVIMSSDSSHHNRERAFAGGALQFLEKPFERSEIHSVLRSTFGEYPQPRNHRRFLCRIPLRFSIVAPAPEEAQCDLDNLTGIIADVGAGGIRLRTEYPLREGQSIHAQIAAWKDPVLGLVPPQAKAEVVWVSPAQDFVTAGLKFI
jgi:CheY-like chemotaxis protein